MRLRPEGTEPLNNVEKQDPDLQPKGLWIFSWGWVWKNPLTYFQFLHSFRLRSLTLMFLPSHTYYPLTRPDDPKRLRSSPLGTSSSLGTGDRTPYSLTRFETLSNRTPTTFLNCSLWYRDPRCQFVRTPGWTKTPFSRPWPLISLLCIVCSLGPLKFGARKKDKIEREKKKETLSQKTNSGFDLTLPC